MYSALLDVKLSLNFYATETSTSNSVFAQKLSEDLFMWQSHRGLCIFNIDSTPSELYFEDLRCLFLVCKVWMKPVQSANQVKSCCSHQHSFFDKADTLLTKHKTWREIQRTCSLKTNEKVWSFYLSSNSILSRCIRQGPSRQVIVPSSFHKISGDFGERRWIQGDSAPINHHLFSQRENSVNQNDARRLFSSLVGRILMRKDSPRGRGGSPKMTLSRQSAVGCLVFGRFRWSITPHISNKDLCRIAVTSRNSASLCDSQMVESQTQTRLPNFETAVCDNVISLDCPGKRTSRARIARCCNMKT